jgi:hypothetical protein
MMRKAGAFMLLAALGGGCSSMDKTGPAMNQYGATSRAKQVPGVQGAWGEPVAMTAQANPPTPVKPAIATTKPDGGTRESGSSGVIQAGLKVKKGAEGSGGGPGMAAPPPGAVAALGSLPGIPIGAPGAMGAGRTSVRFTGPAGMKVAWFAPNTPGANNGFTPAQVEVPGRYNFVQGGIYRLKLSDIPNRAAMELYPTLDVKPTNYRTCTFLAHSAVPVSFTEEDFEQVAAGNLVIKVVYLPDPQFQDLAVAGPDEIVSTRLEPGVDPILEAERRGSVLLVIRMGNIDLEAPNTPAMNAPPSGAPFGGMPLMAPPGGVMPGQMPPPGPLPPGIAPNAPGRPGVPPNMMLPQTPRPAPGTNGSVSVDGIIGRVK